MLTEADAQLGLANRLAAPLADRVFLAYPLPARGRRTTRWSGARSLAPTSRRRGRRRARSSGCATDVFVLAVFGALAGARRINEACVAAYGADGLEGGIVLHVTGARDYAQVRRGRDGAARALPRRSRRPTASGRSWRPPTWA